MEPPIGWNAGLALVRRAISTMAAAIRRLPVGHRVPARSQTAA
jgi:hypothetical protein